MKTFFTTSIGRLRVIAFLEGISLILLVGIAMPMKYALDKPELNYYMGRIHGGLFLLFILGLLGAAIEYRWKFLTAVKVFVLSSFIPFGTFYTDYKILKPLHKGVIHGK